MKESSFNPGFTEFTSEEEMKSEDRSLLQDARQSALDSYAPYSKYQVGAAVKLENGVIITGNNQENAAYPSGLCAERVALYYAQSKYPGVAVESIAITARSASFTVDEPVPPCGACRQVMAEYEGKQGRPMRVIMGGEKGKVIIAGGMDVLLPLKFDAGKLKKRS